MVTMRGFLPRLVIPEKLQKIDIARKPIANSILRLRKTLTSINQQILKIVMVRTPKREFFVMHRPPCDFFKNYCVFIWLYCYKLCSKRTGVTL